jgi:hypothetical protein
MENEKKNDDERNDSALPLCLNQFASVGETRFHVVVVVVV